MIKHTQTIRRKEPANFLSVFDYFVGLALKGLLLSLDVSYKPNKFYYPQIYKWVKNKTKEDEISKIRTSSEPFGTPWSNSIPEISVVLILTLWLVVC